MSETRAPYLYQRISDGTRVAYPGTHLELLAEALDDLKEIRPDVYEKYQTVHDAIDEVLYGEVPPADLIVWLTRPRWTPKPK